MGAQHQRVQRLRKERERRAAGASAACCRICSAAVDGVRAGGDYF
jgi:hypothetical protein